MLFKRFINSLDSAQSFKLVINAILISLCLSACSATPELDKDNSDIVDKASVEQNEIATVQTVDTAPIAVEQGNVAPAKNLYLQQQLDNPVIITEVVQQNYQQALTLMKEKKGQQAQTLFE